jgi:hypothetical protein
MKKLQEKWSYDVSGAEIRRAAGAYATRDTIDDEPSSTFDACRVA